eukprot:XP_014786220.1 PREDICTED: nuclear valosin-containing protein-like [Octopus bimaculoides]
MVNWKTRSTMSSKKKSLSGKESQYFMDPKLIPRVRQYLSNHSSLKSFSVGTMARELQIMYGDYARKKRIAFLKSVEKAYQIICDDDHSSEEGDDFTMQLEKKHLLNKSNYKYADDCIDIESDTTDKSFSSDNTDYVSFKDTNMMNNFMTKVYQGHSKKPLKDDKNASSFMEVSPHPKTTALPQTTPHFKSSQPSPSSSSISSYLHLQNGIPSSLTVNSPLGLHQHTPQQQQISPALPPTSSSSYVGGSTPLVTTTPKTSLHSMPKSFKNHHSYSADSFRHVKGQKSSSTIPNSSRMPLAKSVERKKKILVRTPDERGSGEKTPMDVSATTPRLKRIRSSESKYYESEQKPTKNDDYGFQYSTVTFADVGGNEKCLMELEVPFLKLAATELVSGVSGESEQKMRQIFEKARTNAPCILFFDEIDVITPKRETASKDMERRIVAQLLTCLDDLNDVKKSPDNVLVIGATNRPDSLDPALRRAGRFDREISLGIPDKIARQRILQVLCKNLKLSDNFNYSQLAHMTPGFVGADLSALSREAAMVAINRVFKEIQNKKKLKMDTEPTKMDQSINNSLKTNNELECSTEFGISSGPLWAMPAVSFMSEELLLALSWLREEPPLSPAELESVFITMDDFMEAVKLVQPSAKREGFATIPDVTWDDIGALHNIREDLKLAILAPVKYPERFKSLGLTRAPGILLAGPPGCGKTMLAKAISNESGINFISVKGPELLNMYVGESERAVRQVFQRARNSSPCVIFFDELDSLCPRRSESGEGGASARVVNQMLTEMDGLEERKQVFVIAATNRPDIIDPAILRPGRLDKTLYVSFPSESDRLDILRTITKDGAKPKLSDKSLLETIAKDTRCTGFSGADLSSLICEASVSAMKESITNCPHEDSKNFPVVTVTDKHIEIAFSKVKPSVSTKDRQIWLGKQL